MSFDIIPGIHLVNVTRDSEEKNQQTTSEKAPDSSCDTLSNELAFLDR